MCDSRFSGFMNGSHEGCIRVERGVVSLGNFLSSEETGRSRVAMRESMVVRRDALIPTLSPFGSLAMMTSVDCTWGVQSLVVRLWIVMSLSQLCMSSSQRGARFLSSLWEYFTGLHCCRTSLSSSFVPTCSWSVVRFS